jgi:uncharacterized membrane protein
MASVLIALSAALAVAVELLEAMAIVVAVGATRRWRDALIGAAGGAIACVLLAAILGPALTQLDLKTLQLVIGTLLLLYGLEWLRKNTLRLAGRRARASSVAEYDETVDELADDPMPPEGSPDWAGRVVAFKGVLLEGAEIVVIVAALASRPAGAAPAIIGALAAGIVVISLGVWLRRPLERIPETELKWGVGVILSSFGLFFTGEGLGVAWPGGDAALIGLVLILAGVSEFEVRRLKAAA